MTCWHDVLTVAWFPVLAALGVCYGAGYVRGKAKEVDQRTFWYREAADLSERHDRFSRAVGKMLPQWAYQEWYRRNVETG
jgi:hypothetical protein